MNYFLFSVSIIIVILLSTYCFSFFIRMPSNSYSFISKELVTMVKGFSIVIIMLGHLGNLFGIRFLNPLGSWGVGIFLFVSGFGLQISFNNKRLKGYWKNRIINAYIPYLIFEIVSFVFFYKQMEFKYYVGDLLLVDTCHPFGWYMQCLFLYYIIFYLSSLFKKDIIKIVGLLFASVLIFIFLRSLFREQIWMFTFGVFVAIYYDKFKIVKKKILFGVILFCIGLVFLAIRQFEFIRINEYVMDFITSFEVFGLAIGTILVFDWLYEKKFFALKPFYYIGLISFELYLVHFLFVLPISYLTIVHFWIASMVVALIYYLFRKGYSELFKFIYLKINQ